MSVPNQQLLLPSWVASAAAGLPDAGLASGVAILVDGEKIAAIGPAAELRQQYAQVEQVDLRGHLLIPGLINLHTHAAMSLLRGVADDLPLERWLSERIWPIEARLVSPEFVFDGAVMAAHEMLLGGVTFFNDMYFYPESTARAVLALGMRASIGIPILDMSTAYASSAPEYLRKGLDVRDKFRGETSLRFSLAPHAPYTVGDESFREIAALSAELGLSINCHVHETALEIDQSLARYGRRPLQRLAELGVLGPEFIAVHAVHMANSDIELLAEHGVTVAHCPHSNLKLGARIAPVAALRRAGVRVGIGTDGSASNNRLDLLAEMRTAILLAAGVGGEANGWNAHAALRSVTIDAATALGIDAQIGSIEVGKVADLVSLDLTGPSFEPVYDPVSHFAYCVGRENVADVWIAGRSVVRKRQVVSAAARRTVEEVTVRQVLWHNSIGELVKAGQ